MKRFIFLLLLATGVQAQESELDELAKLVSSNIDNAVILSEFAEKATVRINILANNDKLNTIKTSILASAHEKGPCIAPEGAEYYIKTLREIMAEHPYEAELIDHQAKIWSDLIKVCE